MVCNAIGKCQKQNHRKESINHVKAGKNETRRKLKTKNQKLRQSYKNLPPPVSSVRKTYYFI
ncbi:hypothetical protein [Leptospira noguchii]|uniref:Uncharacterized protein n=1 Tax=Leptospira noguchii TaxID=28182 RepID=A0AAE9GE84_9LEPT|nr:hypothetical protein [Leptospira noguchii]UOG57260.1 hypothetical protein MAL03_03530 [Leptospira noguchii]